LEELARTNTTFKLAGKTNLPLNNVNKRAESYIDARDSHFNVLLSQFSLMVVFKVLVALGLLLLGGMLVIQQQMNIGQFVAAELIILLVINSAEKIILSFETIYDVLTSLEKMGQVTDLELDTGGNAIANKQQVGGQIDMENVTFSYPNETHTTIDHLSLKIEAGDRVLITGKNDSGKSTLLYLMAGLYHPNSGSVSIDNIPYQNYDYGDVHSVIGGYLRDERLFEGTLLENITIGRENATFDRVQWAISNLGLLDLVKNLPYGYDTKILPHGRQFSKSTVAKILIARSIVDLPRIVLLENSFSFFTQADRIHIQRFILDKKYPWTVLLTSTQAIEVPELIDREIVLESGKIVNIKN
jgi:ABC-type bacteriocin/lantibiotic exporter with double-glycine peptidase domain